MLRVISLQLLTHLNANNIVQLIILLTDIFIAIYPLRRT